MRASNANVTLILQFALVQIISPYLFFWQVVKETVERLENAKFDNEVF